VRLCNTCGKPHLLGFDYDHALDQPDDFISRTIEQVDQYLAGERKEHERQLSLESPCAGCGEQPQSCTCAPNTAAWDYEAWVRATSRPPEPVADEWDAESMAEYEEWSAHVDEELWDRFCAAHGDERDEDGLCPQCRQEIADERRNDA